MRKTLCAFLAIAILCAALFGCASVPDKLKAANIQTESTALVGNIPISFPLTETPKTFRILITGAGGRNQEDVLVWQKYEEMTGITIDWDTVDKETRAEKVYAALSNRRQYDLILRCKLSATRLAIYGQSGLILDLAKDDMLKEHAPNCWAFLHSHPDALASVMNPDGSIYALPQVNAGAELRVALKIFVNKAWLERVNGKLPTTTEELRALLTAFQEQDANGNGDPNDEIPLCTDIDSLRMALYGAFGLANRGYHNDTVDCDPETGKARLIEGSEAYRAFLQYTAGLYADGLVDKNLFDLTNDQLAGNIAVDRAGVIVSTNLALLPADKAENWVAIEQALTGPEGEALWSPIRANFHSTGAAVLPATCSDPTLALKWLDYFWTDEGTLFYHMGTEGETYEKLEDGSYDYLPGIYAEMSEKNRSFDDVISKYSPYPGGSNPTVEIAPYFRGGEMAEVPARAARALMAYGSEEYWPSFTFTQAENDALEGITGDFRKYASGMRVDFITGAKSLDEWDAYVARLYDMGASEMLATYQAAIDRYHALSEALNKE